MHSFLIVQLLKPWLPLILFRSGLEEPEQVGVVLELLEEEEEVEEVEEQMLEERKFLG